VEDRITAELDQRGLLVKSGSPTPRRLTYSDLSQLPYLNAVIKVSDPRQALSIPEHTA
jgi:hypothetical protein